MSFKTMSIRVTPGTKVRYMDRNGYDADRRYAREFLIPGNVYTVAHIEVHSSSSNVALEEVPDKRFNTVMFMEVVEDA